MRIFFILFLLLGSGFTALAAPKAAVLSPGAAEAVLAIGGRVYGRSSACTMNALAHLPVVGDLGQPHVEKLLRAGIKMVITDTMAPGNSWRLLRRAGIEVVKLSNSRINDYPANLRLLGEKLSCRAQAEDAARNYENKIAHLRRTRPRNLKRVLILFAANPPVTCGKNTFINEAVECAGGANAGAYRGSGFFAISPEAVLRHAPQIIICAGVPENAVRQYFAKGVFRLVPAVRYQRFYSVSADRFCRNNPGLPAEIEKLKTVLAALP